MKQPLAVRGLAVFVIVGAAFGLAACGGADAPEDFPRVVFSNLSDGDVVASPVNVCLEATNIAIEASGEIVDGSGHHHVLIDLDESEREMFTSPGNAIPKDVEPRYLHIGDGSGCTEIELLPGQHTLTAVVADGGHVTLDPSVHADVTVMVE